jgi:hypothetical protein
VSALPKTKSLQSDELLTHSVLRAPEQQKTRLVLRATDKQKTHPVLRATGPLSIARGKEEKIRSPSFPYCKATPHHLNRCRFCGDKRPDHIGRNCPRKPENLDPLTPPQITRQAGSTPPPSPPLLTLLSAMDVCPFGNECSVEDGFCLQCVADISPIARTSKTGMADDSSNADIEKTPGPSDRFMRSGAQTKIVPAGTSGAPAYFMDLTGYDKARLTISVGGSGQSFAFQTEFTTPHGVFTIWNHALASAESTQTIWITLPATNITETNYGGLPARRTAIYELFNVVEDPLSYSAVSVSNLPPVYPVEVTNTPATASNVTVTNFPSTQQIQGTISVDNFPASQSVTVLNNPDIQKVKVTNSSPIEMTVENILPILVAGVVGTTGVVLAEVINITPIPVIGVVEATVTGAVSVIGVSNVIIDNAAVPITITDLTTHVTLDNANLAVTTQDPVNVSVTNLSLPVTVPDPINVNVINPNLSVTTADPLNVLVTNQTLAVTTPDPLNVLVTNDSLSVTTPDPLNVLITNTPLEVTVPNPLVVQVSNDNIPVTVTNTSLAVTTEDPLNVLIKNTTVPISSSTPLSITGTVVVDSSARPLWVDRNSSYINPSGLLTDSSTADIEPNPGERSGSLILSELLSTNRFYTLVEISAEEANQMSRDINALDPIAGHVLFPSTHDVLDTPALTWKDTNQANNSEKTKPFGSGGEGRARPSQTKAANKLAFLERMAKTTLNKVATWGLVGDAEVTDIKAVCAMKNYTHGDSSAHTALDMLLGHISEIEAKIILAKAYPNAARLINSQYGGDILDKELEWIDRRRIVMPSTSPVINIPSASTHNLLTDKGLTSYLRDRGWEQNTFLQADDEDHVARLLYNFYSQDEEVELIDSKTGEKLENDRQRHAFKYEIKSISVREKCQDEGAKIVVVCIEKNPGPTWDLSDGVSYTENPPTTKFNATTLVTDVSNGNATTSSLGMVDPYSFNFKSSALDTANAITNNILTDSDFGCVRVWNQLGGTMPPRIGSKKISVEHALTALAEKWAAKSGIANPIPRAITTADGSVHETDYYNLVNKPLVEPDSLDMIAYKIERLLAMFKLSEEFWSKCWTDGEFEVEHFLMNATPTKSRRIIGEPGVFDYNDGGYGYGPEANSFPVFNGYNAANSTPADATGRLFFYDTLDNAERDNPGFDTIVLSTRYLQRDADLAIILSVIMASRVGNKYIAQFGAADPFVLVYHQLQYQIIEGPRSLNVVLPSKGGPSVSTPGNAVLSNLFQPKAGPNGIFTDTGQVVAPGALLPTNYRGVAVIQYVSAAGFLESWMDSVTYHALFTTLNRFSTSLGISRERQAAWERVSLNSYSATAPILVDKTVLVNGSVAYDYLMNPNLTERTTALGFGEWNEFTSNQLAFYTDQDVTQMIPDCSIHYLNMRMLDLFASSEVNEVVPYIGAPLSFTAQKCFSIRVACGMTLFLKTLGLSYTSLNAISNQAHPSYGLNALQSLWMPGPNFSSMSSVRSSICEAALGFITASTSYGDKVIDQIFPSQIEAVPWGRGVSAFNGHASVVPSILPDYLCLRYAAKQFKGFTVVPPINTRLIMDRLDDDIVVRGGITLIGPPKGHNENILADDSSVSQSERASWLHRLALSIVGAAPVYYINGVPAPAYSSNAVLVFGSTLVNPVAPHNFPPGAVSCLSLTNLAIMPVVSELGELITLTVPSPQTAPMLQLFDAGLFIGSYFLDVGTTVVRKAAGPSVGARFSSPFALGKKEMPLNSKNEDGGSREASVLLDDLVSTMSATPQGEPSL